MKKLILSTLLGFSSLAWSQSPVMFEGVDISAAVEYFAPYVATLDKPVMMYSWSQSPQFASHPHPVEIARGSARAFWRSYGAPNPTLLVYGRGLYAAMDPIQSMSYGGFKTSWLLLEMKVPRGLRVFEITEPEINIKTDPTKMLEVARAFQCPEEPGFEPLVHRGGSDLTPECRRYAHFLLNDVLKIDGFFYPYAGATFAACGGIRHENVQGRAFVALTDHWLAAEGVHYYNYQSRENPEQRRRIQTLLFKYRERAGDEGTTGRLLYEKYNAIHGNEDLIYENKCGDSVCTLLTRSCDAEDRCTYSEVATYGIEPELTKITNAEASRMEPGRLFWPDLEGQAMASTDAWLRENKFACDGRAPLTYPPRAP